MTAELQDCNGAVEGLRVEYEEVEVQTNPKAILVDENSKLEEEEKVCNGTDRENLKLDEDTEDFSGDGSENLKVNEESENLKLNEDKVICNGDASESLKTKEDDMVCSGDQIENLNPSDEYEGSDGDGIESWTLIKDETVCNGDEIENSKSIEDETACNGDEGDNSEKNEDKTVCNGDLSESLESVCNGAGSGICAKGVDNDDNLSVSNCKEHEPEFVSVQAKPSDQPPEMVPEDPDLHMLGTVGEVRDLQCLISENNEVESHLMEKGEDILDSESLVEDCPNHEVHDLVNEHEEEPELQCLENEKIDVETENSKNEETEHTFEVRVDGDREVGEPDLNVQDEEKPEQDFEDEEKQQKNSEFQIDQVQELESQGVLTEELDSEPLPVVDMNCELVALETQNLISEETKPESHIMNDEFESDGMIQENRHDTSNHVINEPQDFEHPFVINLDDFPVLQSAVDKSIELESHVVNGENTSYLQRWPNGSNVVESHMDASDDKVIESEFLVNGSTNLISEDIHGENNELHHSKDEICDVESGSCNESNPGGVSDTLLETCGICNGTEQSKIQEDKADIADWVSAVGPDPSNVTSISGNVQKREAEIPKKTFYCLAKIPRHVDNKIKVQIRLAQLQLNEKTESRDFIKAAIQMKRASREQMLDKLKAARQEERSIREAIRSKRQLMEPLQLTMNKLRNASSAEEYDDKIYQMQYRIEHESMPLREEKQLLRDIKQLKISRDEIFANSGSRSELEEAFENISAIQQSSQLLGQELESLRKQGFQAEKNTLAIQKDFEALNDNLRQLQAQWSAAGGVRQDAYENLRVLKKQEYERNNEFYQNKSDIQEAKQHALARERDALDKLCSNQVNRIIEMWVKNPEFRREYMKDNERSTLRRLETLDGRSLGPDEEPPLPTNYGDEFESSVLPRGKPPSGTKPEKEDKSNTTLQQSIVVEPKPKEQQSLPKEIVMPLKNSDVKSKKSKKGSLDSIPKIESFEMSTEPIKKEEEDLAKMEEEAAKMKEVRRLEEMRKAKEAEERKRRLAERANAKALARAQKEAERKEKERQKKANKKAAAVAATVSNMTGNDTTSSETKNDASHDLQSSPIVEAKELTSTTQKYAPSQRKKSVSQKAKSKSIFPAAAKRNRKGIQTWMLILLAAVFCMFLLILWFYI